MKLLAGSDTPSNTWGKHQFMGDEGHFIAWEPPSDYTTKGELGGDGTWPGWTPYPPTSSAKKTAKTKTPKIETIVAHQTKPNAVAFVHTDYVFPYIIEEAKDSLWRQPGHEHRRMWLLEADFAAAGGAASPYDIAMDEFKPLKK